MNYFENLLEMQKNMMEEQRKVYENIAKNFNFNFNGMDFFKNFNDFNFYQNPEDFFKEYLRMQDYFSKYYKEAFNKFPGFDKAMQTYKANLNILDKIFKAYGDLFTNGDLSKAGDNLIDLYRIFNDQLVELSKNNVEKFLPINFFEIMANFPVDTFINPFINSTKKSMEFYQKALDKEPKLMTDQIEKFYKSILDKLDEIPSVGISQEEKKRNRQLFENYLILSLKIYDFNLYLSKASRQAAIDAQNSYFDRLEEEKGLENFSDFYKFYIDNLCDAYKNLVDSPVYKQKAKAILDLVNNNKEMFDNYIEDGLGAFPIVTQNKLKEYLDKLEDMTSILMDIQNENDDSKKGTHITKSELSKDKNSHGTSEGK